MPKRKIHITHQDASRLHEWLLLTASHHEKDRENLQVLRRELERAQLIEPDEIPPDVVTMHSQVRLVDVDTDQEMRCALVFPEDSLVADERISVLAPLGAAILGCRAGDVVRFRTPGGWRSVRIVKVLYQPEAAGHFNL